MGTCTNLYTYVKITETCTPKSHQMRRNPSIYTKSLVHFWSLAKYHLKMFILHYYVNVCYCPQHYKREVTLPGFIRINFCQLSGNNFGTRREAGPEAGPVSYSSNVNWAAFTGLTGSGPSSYLHRVFIKYFATYIKENQKAILLKQQELTVTQELLIPKPYTQLNRPEETSLQETIISI